MARRGPIALAIFLDAFVRTSGAIALDACAFVVWNLAARSPLHLVRDLRNAVRDPRDVFANLVAAIVGIIFLGAGALLVLPAVVDAARDFVPIELGTLLVALATDYLVGDELRALATSRRET